MLFLSSRVSIGKVRLTEEQRRQVEEMLNELHKEDILKKGD